MCLCGQNSYMLLVPLVCVKSRSVKWSVLCGVGETEGQCYPQRSGSDVMWDVFSVARWLRRQW